jgi:hypothetical protein
MPRKRQNVCLECATCGTAHACYLAFPSPPGDFPRKGTFKCLRRILPCAWSTRQRTCFLTRRVPCCASSRATSDRCRGCGPAFLSGTGSSSSAIRACATYACADSSNTRLRHRSQQRRWAAATSPGDPAAKPAKPFPCADQRAIRPPAKAMTRASAGDAVLPAPARASGASPPLSKSARDELQPAAT